MNKKIFAIPLCALFVVSAACFSACGGNNDNGGDNNENTLKYGLKPTEEYVLPDYGERTESGVAVHDPSVFRDPKGGKYYAFGSHYAVASSDDLITWKQELKDNEHTKLFTGGVTAAMPQTTALAQGATDAWAPDVEYHDGKYYMYISFTTGFGSNRSVISRVESDNVLGPYSNETIIIESVTSNQPDKPNCIDPELFHDKDGGLWMVYGSFFGGVYIKALNSSGENWGLPQEEGWGTLIWKTGYSDGVEGPYVFYNNLTDYYYLMVSEGDLFTVYNMRFARSKNPDGPYEDITGGNVATASGKGNKVAGNYKFARQTVQPGYAALGHNSVIKDADGRYFVVYHTRREDVSADKGISVGHNLCVSQLFFNEEGWPVMSPVCYEGEAFGIVPEADLVTDYEVVIHSEQTVKTIVKSEDYSFTDENKVQKGNSEVGTWSIKDGYYVTITLGTAEYNGVVVPGWDMYTANKNNREGKLCITAVSDEGVSLWAIAK